MVVSLGLAGSIAPAAEAATKNPAPLVVKIEAGPVRYAPRVITVTAGRPVILRITNSSNVDHEALLGDEKAQNAHAKEMKDTAAMPGMKHANPSLTKPGEGFVEIAPKKTAEIKTTFSKVGRTIIGCHLPGHYEGGMRLTVIVKAPSLGGA